MNLPYSFDPLFCLLNKYDLSMEDLVIRNIISKGTAEKILNGNQVMLSTAAKICIGLGCELSDIVELNYAYNPTDVVDDDTQSYKQWTDEEEERLIDEYNNGFSIPEIARNLKRTPSAITSRIKKLISAKRLFKR